MTSPTKATKQKENDYEKDFTNKGHKTEKKMTHENHQRRSQK
jgi:hypothetical protein